MLDKITGARVHTLFELRLGEEGMQALPIWISLMDKGSTLLLLVDHECRGAARGNFAMLDLSFPVSRDRLHRELRIPLDERLGVVSQLLLALDGLGIEVEKDSAGRTAKEVN